MSVDVHDPETVTQTSVVDLRRPLSVVIPAHDEEVTIGACLDRLLGELGEADVIVVANGCTDRTAEVARAVPGVRVIELDAPSKAAALNAGDAAAFHHPRVYLDADIRIDGPTLRSLGDALSDQRPLAASPRVVFDTSASSWPVRAFYRVYGETAYVRDRLVGLGVYGLSAAGRSRFPEFPDLFADDLFVQRLFDLDERVTTVGSFTVSAPRDLASLIAVRTRVAQGNRGLEETGAERRFARSTTNTSRFLRDLVRRRPTFAPAVLVYVAVTLAGRLAARRARPDEWRRDLSTRVPAQRAAAHGGSET